MTDALQPLTPEQFTQAVNTLAEQFNALCVETRTPVVIVACLTLIHHGALLGDPDSRMHVIAAMRGLIQQLEAFDATPRQ